MSASTIPLTSTSEQGIRSLFEGLCAFVETIELGAPAEAGIAVTPSVQQLLHHFCQTDPRYARMVANLYVLPRAVMKQYRTEVFFSCSR